MPTLRDWQQTYKDPKTLIVQASTQDGLDGWTEFPIGMGFAWDSCSASLIGDHSNLVLCALSTSSDNGKARNGVTRLSVVNTLKEVGIENIKLHPKDYFARLPSYKFVVSPEGNGIDCHRHYEALLAGCIPIIERNPLTERKYAGCPILWTTDYSEITSEYLEEKYTEMIDKEYDFSRLFVAAYPPHLQRQLKDNSAYWMKKLTGKPFYTNKLLPFLKIV